MKSYHDKYADAVYLQLKKGKISHSRKMSDRIVADLDKKGNVLGLEILDASSQISQKSLKQTLEEGSIPFISRAHVAVTA